MLLPCPWRLAPGSWLSTCGDKLASTEKFFINPGSNNGTASQRYCSQLCVLVMRHFEVARNHIRVGRAGAHGLRKGAGSAASSATTDPPSCVSVAARGEWLIGKVLDVYFKFAMGGGDQYLGQILALLDPNETTFAILPPHWINPIDSLVLKGIAINFGKIATAHCDANQRRVLGSAVHSRQAKVPGLECLNC